MKQFIVEIGEKVKERAVVFDKIHTEIHKVIVGQNNLVERLMIGLLANGHILLEGVPGLAKTLSISTLAEVIQTSFKRIQFTPDLLPADLIGTSIYNQKTAEFKIKKGPIFTNLLLADEINRAPAKVQSALLEAMQERQVTISSYTFPLSEPFLVLATQNPIEHEGTYQLPEAQLDRFMLKVKVGYPTRKEELEIINRIAEGPRPTTSQVAGADDILLARQLVSKIYVDDKIKRYIIDITFATRAPREYGLDLGGLINFGASPRASIFLTTCAKAYAFLQKRGYVIPEDVKGIAMDVLRHRVAVTYEAEAEAITSEDIVRQVLDKVKVP